MYDNVDRYFIQGSYQHRIRLQSDLKLFRYNDPKVKFRLKCLENVFFGLILCFGKERKKFTVAGNHKYRRKQTVYIL